jgi:signal transduction histidine kinase
LSAVVGNAETLDLLHHRDGRVFEVSSRPQYLAEQIVGRVYGFQDITERKKIEEALRESRDMLESRVRERTADLYVLNETLRQEKDTQANLIKKLEAAQDQLMQSERLASIGQLAAGVAHEINNPVGFVNSNLSSLQRYVGDLLRMLSTYEEAEVALPSANREHIAHVKEEVDMAFLRDDVNDLLAESLDGLKRVTRIVQDLKNFSHVDEQDRQWADLESGLESTLRVAWNELKYKTEVVKEYSGISQIECFPSQLNQVFMNLLVNAAQAIDEHGKITIRTAEDATHVWVEIQDTGKGIKPEHLNRIFDPFFTTKPVGKGTGLGLSLAYGIVKKHDGHIEVKSELGVGTTFRVVLPKSLSTA